MSASFTNLYMPKVKDRFLTHSSACTVLICDMGNFVGQESDVYLDENFDFSKFNEFPRFKK